MGLFDLGISAVFEGPSQTELRVMRCVLNPLAPRGILCGSVEGAIELRARVAAPFGVFCVPGRVSIVSGALGFCS
ncbi:MAG: hypothetical protein AAGI50_04095 [Pseudomonadota bacterium]